MRPPLRVRLWYAAHRGVNRVAWHFFPTKPGEQDHRMIWRLNSWLASHWVPWWLAHRWDD